MTRRRTGKGGKGSGRRDGSLAQRPAHGYRLSTTPFALIVILAVGVLIGFALAYHFIERQPAPQIALAPAPQPAAKPVQRAQPSPTQPTAAPPRLDRSPFARPQPNAPAAGPHAALTQPNAPAGLEPAVARIPPPPGEPAWKRNAVAVSVPPGRPLIAIVIDDVGVNRRNAARVAELPAPVTIAYMTYADNLAKLGAEARARGHELMLHVPMEPMGHGVDAGPNALTADLPPDEIRRRLSWGLDRLSGYVGINNHMGSRFTASEPAMAVVMEELRRRGLLFVDSRTIGESVGARMAQRYGVPHADRDVFLDNVEESGAVHEQLAKLEQVARERGMAIGIGHPHDGTIAALAHWLPQLQAKGFTLVPVSTIVERRAEHQARSAGAGAPG
jgi:uncharacterized protein